MRILIAPTAYKGTLSPLQAVQAMVEGLRAVSPEAEPILCPISDGGNGWVEVWQFHRREEAKRLTCTVRDPLRRPVQATYLILSAHSTPLQRQIAVLESASACGLHLLQPEERDPLRTSTEGVGDLIQHALDRGVEEVWLGVGGSATTDAGVGALRALGFEFVDARGEPIPPGGIGLSKLETILPPSHLPTADLKRFVCACDVLNPLYGKQGAAFVFAPQKGASTREVRILERGLRRFAQVVRRQQGIPLETLPGAGAAGGLSAGLKMGIGTQLVSGIQFLLDQIRWDEQLALCDLLLTGEGRVDAQTWMGKGVGELVRQAVRLGKPVWLVAGSRGTGWQPPESLPGVHLAVISELVPDKEPALALREAVRSMADREREVRTPSPSIHQV